MHTFRPGTGRGINHQLDSCDFIDKRAITTAQ
ncbi:hypothetical protein M2316_002495 [Cellulosimicrobium cellulans]|nr:hypothetical protein [Cellulosimicrobium cellulans]